MTSRQPSCTCELCGLVFDSEWSDEEAEAEEVALFGAATLDEDGRAIVCDDCFQMMTAQVPPAEWVAARRAQA